MDDKLDGSEPIELLNMNHDEKADELGKLSRGRDCNFFCTLHTVGLHITRHIQSQARSQTSGSSDSWGLWGRKSPSLSRGETLVSWDLRDAKTAEAKRFSKVRNVVTTEIHRVQ